MLPQDQPGVTLPPNTGGTGEHLPPISGRGGQGNDNSSQNLLAAAAGFDHEPVDKWDVAAKANAAQID